MAVELRLREHCPPHVHVENEEERWEARFEFSFISDLVRLMDVDPLVNAPTAKTIAQIKAAIAANLATCRKEWWERIGLSCLDNRWMRLASGGELGILRSREKGAGQIAKSAYDVAAQEVVLSMKDGALHRKDAGKGVDDGDPAYD